MTLIASLPVATEETATALVEALGACEDLDAPTAGTTEQPDGSWVVDIYFESEPDEALLGALIRGVLGDSVPAYAVTPLAAEDWVAKSLEGLKPVRAGRFLVHGSHDRDKVGPDDIAIEIEAGEAFGTGHHGTTAGCLAEIDRLCGASDIRSILDLGTGSGVLAIAIAKGFGKAVLATDIDAVATRVTRENAALNGVEPLIEAATAEGFDDPVFAAHAPFDLIIANILAGPLVALAPEIARHLNAERGIVMLSGLLTAQGPTVIAAYEAQGLRLVRSGESEGWLTLTLSRG